MPYPDRDGTIDLLITTCASVSRSTGLGSSCALNIAYNMQLPLCAPSSSFPFPRNPATATPCRSPDTLCVADPNFSFSFSGPVRYVFPLKKLLTYDWLEHKNYVSVPIPDLLQGDARLHVLDTSFSPPQPILPRTGDSNLDGFPDLLLITEGRVRLLISTPCARGIAGCAAPGARRGWRELRKNADALTGITDARVAVFVDLDEDGTLDVMVQRTGEQGAGRILFVQNNFYYDAFFMKAIRTGTFLSDFPSHLTPLISAPCVDTVLNGACSSGWCQPENSSLPRYPVSSLLPTFC